MLKKIALVMLLALPMGVFAQNLLLNFKEPKKNSTRNIRNSSKLSLRILFRLISLKEDRKSCRI